MTTVAGLAHRIGDKASYLVNNLEVDVTVLDARQTFGRVDVLIEPVAGKGSRWVRMSALRFDGDAEATDGAV